MKKSKKIEDILNADPKLHSLQPPKTLDDKKFWRTANKFLFVYSMVGLFTGLIFFFVGAWLIVEGMNEKSGVSIELGSLNIEISDATPGILLILLSIAIMYFTKYKIHARN